MRMLSGDPAGIAVCRAIRRSYHRYPYGFVEASGNRFRKRRTPGTQMIYSGDRGPWTGGCSAKVLFSY